jgi:hypothetical protein
LKNWISWLGLEKRFWISESDWSSWEICCNICEKCDRSENVDVCINLKPTNSSSLLMCFWCVSTWQ